MSDTRNAARIEDLKDELAQANTAVEINAIREKIRLLEELEQK